MRLPLLRPRSIGLQDPDPQPIDKFMRGVSGSENECRGAVEEFGGGGAEGIRAGQGEKGYGGEE